MSTISCPKCQKHGKISPIENPSQKEKSYFKCGDCGALFDQEDEFVKTIGTALGGALAGAVAIFSFIGGGS